MCVYIYIYILYIYIYIYGHSFRGPPSMVQDAPVGWGVGSLFTLWGGFGVAGLAEAFESWA